MPTPRNAGPRCRQIGPSDLSAVADLLTRGFPARGPAYWRRALDRLGRRSSPPDCPKFGYLLELKGCPVGVVLTIFSSSLDGGAAPIRCNVSSWYVEPAFRPYASPLVSLALKRKDVTYTNISPAPHTRSIIEAQGFSRYSDGQFLVLPVPRWRSAGVRIEEIGPGRGATEMDLPERPLVDAHAEYGCCSVLCTASGAATPFIIAPRRIWENRFPSAHLIYCRDSGEMPRFAAELAWFLLKRKGLLGLTFDAKGPLPGLAGRFFAGSGPKYFRGPVRPRLGDLTFTELAMFSAVGADA